MHKPRPLALEQLETRSLLAGNIAARVIDGYLIVQGDGAPNRLRIDNQRLAVGEVRVTPVGGTVNGESAPAVLRGWNSGIRLSLDESDDRVVLDRLNIRGNLLVRSGLGDDIVVLDRSTVRGTSLVGTGGGRDSVHLVNSQLIGGVAIKTLTGNDVIALSHSTFYGPVALETGDGRDTVHLESTFRQAPTLDTKPEHDTVSSNSVEADFDFRRGAEGWRAGFADYPAGQEEFFELRSGIAPLPPEIGSGTGFFISGNNHSDDLFMFLKRRMAQADGVVPNQIYEVRLRVTLASNAPSGAVGIGGAPGESVFLKAGATSVEPKGVTGDRFVRMNVDKGNQASSGSAASVIGDIANGRAPSAGVDKYASLTRTHVHDFLATANSAGELWLLIGTDSGFEGTTSLYYQRIAVELIPVFPPPAVQADQNDAALMFLMSEGEAKKKNAEFETGTAD